MTPRVIEEADPAEADFPHCAECGEWSVFASAEPIFRLNGDVLCHACFLEALTEDKQ
jgi:formylmethanofuran dehydrogenase subunit E